MILEPKHFRAIQNLSMGMSMEETSHDCHVPLSTLYRWKSTPEFSAALDMELKKIQAATPAQLQIIAHESFGAIRDAHRELRAYGLGKKHIEYTRVMALMGVLKFGARWISLAGFDPALKAAAARLAFQQPHDPNAQEVPEQVSLAECGPCADPRPATELRPPPPIFGAYTVDELAEWVRADRIARGLATPEEIGDEREARKALFLHALREIHEEEQREKIKPLSAEWGVKEDACECATGDVPHDKRGSSEDSDARESSEDEAQPKRRPCESTESAGEAREKSA